MFDIAFAITRLCCSRTLGVCDKNIQPGTLQSPLATNPSDGVFKFCVLSDNLPRLGNIKYIMKLKLHIYIIYVHIYA